MLGLGVTGGVAGPSGDNPITISYIQPGSAGGRARLKVLLLVSCLSTQCPHGQGRRIVKQKADRRGQGREGG